MNWLCVIFSLCATLLTGNLKTEQIHPLTERLSQTFHADDSRARAMQLLHSCDERVLTSSASFFKTTDFSRLCKAFHKSLSQALSGHEGSSGGGRGRVFLVGSGSSGRVAVDLAARWRDWLKQLTGQFGSVVAVMAGGARAFVKAKEGSEDSEQEGYETLSAYKLTYKQTTSFHLCIFCLASLFFSSPLLIFSWLACV